jgi:DNA-binding MarR family transcriptional regulator
MLTESQQKMILKMYMKHATTGDGFIKKDDVKDIYSERSSFFRSIRYLVDSGLVERNEVRRNVVYYRLTLSGQLLARVLCSLVDNPTPIKGLKYALRF